MSALIVEGNITWEDFWVEESSQVTIRNFTATHQQINIHMTGSSCECIVEATSMGAYVEIDTFGEGAHATLIARGNGNKSIMFRFDTCGGFNYSAEEGCDAIFSIDADSMSGGVNVKSSTLIETGAIAGLRGNGGHYRVTNGIYSSTFDGAQIDCVIFSNSEACDGFLDAGSIENSTLDNVVVTATNTLKNTVLKNCTAIVAGRLEDMDTDNFIELSNGTAKNCKLYGGIKLVGARTRECMIFDRLEAETSTIKDTSIVGLSSWRNVNSNVVFDGAIGARCATLPSRFSSTVVTPLVDGMHYSYNTQ